MRPYLKPLLRKQIIESEKECYLCGKPVAYVEGSDAPYDRQWRAFDAEGNTFHFEHVVPVAEGGATDESNIRLACRDCNLAKSRKVRERWSTARLHEASKVIKVESQIYDQLDKLRIGRQTFSNVIEALLLNRLKILELMSVLEGQIGFREWQRQELEKLTKKEGGSSPC